jgi:hypothetical protein
MTKKSIQKRKDLKLAKNGKRRIGAKNSERIQLKKRHPLTPEENEKINERVRLWFRKKEVEHKIFRLIENLRGRYRQYNKPKTAEQYRIWIRDYEPLRVSYLEA